MNPFKGSGTTANNSLVGGRTTDDEVRDGKYDENYSDGDAAHNRYTTSALSGQTATANDDDNGNNDNRLHGRRPLSGSFDNTAEFLALEEAVLQEMVQGEDGTEEITEVHPTQGDDERHCQRRALSSAQDDRQALEQLKREMERELEAAEVPRGGGDDTAGQRRRKARERMSARAGGNV